MPAQDFLHYDAETKLQEHYIAAGSVCSFSTNCEQVLESARQTFLPAESPLPSIDFSMRFWIDAPNPGALQEIWPKPYVRGLGHLVFIGFDAYSSVLANLRTRHVIGRFSAAMANDTAHWKTTIFPMLLSVLAGSLGLVELHACCVAKDGQGLILLGPSGSGKSTLARALTDAGFQLLSDDRTFCSLSGRKLLAWGLPRPLKLRREAAAWFDELRGREPANFQNGEAVFHLELKGQRTSICQPRLLVILDRQQHSSFEMSPIASKQVRDEIEKDLLAESAQALRKQSRSLDELLSLSICILHYGGRPQTIAQQLATWFLDTSGCRS